MEKAKCRCLLPVFRFCRKETLFEPPTTVILKVNGSRNSGGRLCLDVLLNWRQLKPGHRIKNLNLYAHLKWYDGAMGNVCLGLCSALSLLFGSISYRSVAEIRHHDQSHLWKTEFILAYGSLGMRVYCSREAWQQEQKAERTQPQPQA